MTTQPKTVAELRASIIAFGEGWSGSLLELIRRAEANERLRDQVGRLHQTAEYLAEDVSDVAKGIETLRERGQCPPFLSIDLRDLQRSSRNLVGVIQKDVAEALAAAPSQEPSDGRDDTLADIRKQLGLAAGCEMVEITEAVRATRANLDRFSESWVASQRALAAAEAGAKRVAVAFQEFVNWSGTRDIDDVAGIHGEGKPMPFVFGCTQMRNRIHIEGCRRIAALTAPAEPKDFPALRDLVARFSAALVDKLIAAEKKYGHNDAWQADDWELACRDRMREHVAKGDPRDVAAYCAFMWHHGWSTAPAEPAKPEPVPAFEGDPKDCAFGLADYVRWANEARGTPQFIHRAADVAMLLAGRALEGK